MHPGRREKTRKRTVTIPYSPQPKQEIFHTCPAFEVLYGGAAGGGKTEALLWEAVISCLERPNFHAIFLRRTFPDLEQSVLVRAQKQIPKSLAKYSAEKHRFTFINGSILDFGHAKEERDVYDYRGAEFGLICFDELTMFTKTQYEFLLTRCRSSDPLVVPRVRAGTNPTGEGRDWVKRRFVDPAAPGRIFKDPKTGLTRCYIHATLYDNPALMRADPNYIKRLEMQPKHVRDALLYGSWDSFEGQAFSEWNPEIHVIEPFPIPDSWTRWATVDWGYAAPFGVLYFAMDRDGYKYLVNEIYGCDPDRPNQGIGLSADVVARLILEHQKQPTYGDPQMWAKHDTGPSVAETMLAAGVPLLKATRDRVQGKLQVHYHLATWRGKPRLRVFSTCRHLIRTLPTLTTDVRDPEKVNTKHSEDHLYDALQYGLMVNPVLPEPVREETTVETFERLRRRWTRNETSEEYAWALGLAS